MQQGVMTKRILGLLWRISLASHIQAPLDMALCFADVLRDYALTSKSADTRELALDYVAQLVLELEGTDKALPALRVLTHLIANSGNHAVSNPLYTWLTTKTHTCMPMFCCFVACWMSSIALGMVTFELQSNTLRPAFCPTCEASELLQLE